MSRPEGYYESIDAEARKLTEGEITAFDLARILVLTQRQLSEAVTINCAGISFREAKQEAQAQQQPEPAQA